VEGGKEKKLAGEWWRVEGEGMQEKNFWKGGGGTVEDGGPGKNNNRGMSEWRMGVGGGLKKKNSGGVKGGACGVEATLVSTQVRLLFSRCRAY